MTNKPGTWTGKCRSLHVAASLVLWRRPSQVRGVDGALFLWQYEILFYNARFTFVIVPQGLRATPMNYNETYVVLWRIFFLSSRLHSARGLPSKTYDELRIFVVDVDYSMTKFQTSCEETSWKLLFLLVCWLSCHWLNRCVAPMLYRFNRCWRLGFSLLDMLYG